MTGFAVGTRVSEASGGGGGLVTCDCSGGGPSHKTPLVSDDFSSGHRLIFSTAGGTIVKYTPTPNPASGGEKALVDVMTTEFK